VSLALAAHLCFSWIGFNPTDDGYFLAISRRLLDGQIPHRDFIAHTTFLSSLLHVPAVALGGEHTFWLSRLCIWLELSTIAWGWMHIICHALQQRVALTERVCMALLALGLGVHTVQITLWPAVDGLTLATLGLILRIIAPEVGSVLGYLLIGCTYLCKQSFLPFVPFMLLLFGDWRRLPRLAAAVLPGAMYLTYLAANNAMDDALLQLFLARRGPVSDMIYTGLQTYAVAWPFPCGILLGLGSVYLITGRPLRGKRWCMLGSALLLASIAGTSVVVLMQPSHSALAFMGLFGVSLGVWLALHMWHRHHQLGMAGALVLVLAWCASLSYGENNPGFAVGALSLFLLGCLRVLTVESLPEARWRLAVWALSCIVIPVIVVARYEHPDGDRRAGDLLYALDGVLPGAAGIYTNVNTYRYLVDLSVAIQRVDGPYAVLRDNSAVWIVNAQANPLSADWIETLDGGVARPGGFAGNPLLARVIGDIDHQRGTLAIILQKVEAGPVFLRFEPLQVHTPARTMSEAVVAHVRHTLVKVDETKFFDIYR
jgi:hypothetical protein